MRCTSAVKTRACVRTNCVDEHESRDPGPSLALPRSFLVMDNLAQSPGQLEETTGLQQIDRLNFVGNSVGALAYGTA
jgi:hypothetical protein